MNIALDFDGTYTLDPALWDQFIAASRLAGHKVICCTMRHEESEGDRVKLALAEKVDRVVFTGRMAKADFLKRRGIEIDVWIDDNPGWIFNDSI